MAAVVAGSSARAAAVRFGLSVSTAIRWAQRWRAEGHAQARPMGGDRRSLLTKHRETVLTLVAQQPDLTIGEIRTAVADKTGLRVGGGTICRFFARHKITLKKRASTPPNRRALMLPKPVTISSSASPLSIRNA